MILFFHFLCLLAQYIVTNISKSISKNRIKLNDSSENNACAEKESSVLNLNKCLKQSVYEDGTLKFFPPVYIQRYETVALILEELAIKQKIYKVVDFGCAELGFFRYLKSIQGINEILEVDIDEEKLVRCSFKAAPLTTDYLMNKNKPLDVYILAGSITEYDDHLSGTDAVIAIEVIEHLMQETLIKGLYNIFHQIKPTVAIFTTPNAEFNSLFPNFTDLRHSDHKFEWTRKEFYTWTQEIISEYPEYTVRFYGIGAGPEGTENLGCCTQMVVFQKVDGNETFDSAREKLDGIRNYKLIQHYSYPVYEDPRTTEEKIIHEIQYQMAHFIPQSHYYNYEENQYEVPIGVLHDCVADLCPDEEELRDILFKTGLRVIQKEQTWCLAQSEAVYSSQDSSFEEECSLNDNSNFSKDGTSLNESWDQNEVFFQKEDGMNFQSARSSDQMKLLDTNKAEQSLPYSIVLGTASLNKDTKTTKSDLQCINQTPDQVFTPNRHIF
ncbi:hypothetical protein RUM44_012816 [Polyplax serrata]|uniref:Small RNA 2'-O-methyltransferase n=1 Tax=Polyplax serrata TaxID=468196 RepID=A0ABR1BG47_POLSC